MGVLEAESALDEIKHRRAELERRMRLAHAYGIPNEVYIRSLERQSSLLLTKQQALDRLRRRVKELEYSLSFKMMTRYPANQQHRTKWRYELHRLRRRMNELAAQYQPRAAENHSEAALIFGRPRSALSPRY